MAKFGEKQRMFRSRGFRTVTMAAAIFAATASSQANSQIRRIAMENRIQTVLHESEPYTGDAKSPVALLRVELSGESHQFKGTGLTFQLSIRNTSTTAAEIQDPEDTIQTELQDEKGQPLQVPTAMPAALLNRGEKAGIRKNAPRLLTIQPDSHHQITLRINEVETSDHGTQALAPGKYKIRFRILLQTDPNLKTGPSSRKLESDLLPVTLDR